MIGIDIVAVARVESAITRWGDKFLGKFLNQSEISLIKSSKTAAGFWAAKEAAAKALGCGICGNLSFHDMTILKTEFGAPFIKLKEQNSFGLDKIYISITHDGGFAAAVAIIK
ncbi:MAG: hypothetical protein RL154_420 [Pseudomonadota bacterium]